MKNKKTFTDRLGREYETVTVICPTCNHKFRDHGPTTYCKKCGEFLSFSKDGVGQVINQ